MIAYKVPIQIKRVITKISLTIGILLFIINLAGLALPDEILFPLKGEQLVNKYREAKKNYNKEHEITGFALVADFIGTHNHVLDGFNKKADESDSDYFERLTKLSHEYIFHYYVLGDERVPIFENWYLFFRNFKGLHEFVNPARILRKGRGWCSQHAIFIAQVLKQNGYDNIAIVHLSGHVLTTVKLPDNSEYLLDGDYGVFIPHGLDDIENDPGLVYKCYDIVPASLRDAPCEGFPSLVSYLEHLYKTSDDNQVIILKKYYRQSGTEVRAYAIKWLFPLFLIVLSMAGLVKKHIGRFSGGSCSSASMPVWWAARSYISTPPCHPGVSDRP